MKRQFYHLNFFEFINYTVQRTCGYCESSKNFKVKFPGVGNPQVTLYITRSLEAERRRIFEQILNFFFNRTYLLVRRVYYLRT